MPELVAMPRWPFSSSPTHSSSALIVGLPRRV